MKVDMFKQFIKKFIMLYIILISAVATINFIIDPYFVYRISDFSQYFSWTQTSSPTWKYGQTKHYSGYDSVWVGSSVSSHVDPDYVSSVLDVNCVCAVMASGRPNIYNRFINNIMENNDLEHIFYELAFSHWCFEAIGTEFDIDQYVEPYILTDSILDDGEYLLNRQVLEESNYILLGFIESKLKDKNEKSQESIMPLDTIYSTKNMASNIVSNTYTYGFSAENYESYLKAGLRNFDMYIAPIIEENPDIEFTFVIPPTGVTLFAIIRDAGCLDEYLELQKMIFSKILSYPNTRIIAGDLDYEYNMDTNNYMDSGHYEPSGGKMLVDFIAHDENEISLDNLDTMLERYRYMAESFSWPFMKLNFVGENVVDLQNKLKTLGYDVSINGVYDYETEDAVREFQEVKGLEVTGIVFCDTLERINEEVEKK